ncbi:hypothetical protein AN642_00470 [Epulopiscium sp. SCG-B10WGA-EpuloA2]|nr:hypothetical protein AN642_00470 [Epulopiscium sp. SCG-B10WGA-EpuloA2]
MFGYVTPLKEELKVRELDLFKSYYCGLCQHIKQDFNNIPRLTLNYDITTMSILLDATANDTIKLKKQPCITSLKKRAIIQRSLPLKYAASVNVLLSYYKLKDDYEDEHSIKSKILLSQLKPYLKNVPQEFRFLRPLISSNLNKLHELEKSRNFNSLDEICEPFANLVGQIIKKYPYNTADKNNLYRFGYSLGKWIYLIDALDDLEKDIEKGSFNPLYILYNNNNLTYDDLFKIAKDKIEFSIFSLGANCKELLYKLAPKKNRALLENIIIYGMMDKYTTISSKCNHCKK